MPNLLFAYPRTLWKRSGTAEYHQKVRESMKRIPPSYKQLPIVVPSLPGTTFCCLLPNTPFPSYRFWIFLLLHFISHIFFLCHILWIKHMWTAVCKLTNKSNSHLLVLPKREYLLVISHSFLIYFPITWAHLIHLLWYHHLILSISTHIHTQISTQPQFVQRMSKSFWRYSLSSLCILSLYIHLSHIFKTLL